MVAPKEALFCLIKKGPDLISSSSSPPCGYLSTTIIYTNYSLTLCSFLKYFNIQNCSLSICYYLAFVDIFAFFPTLFVVAVVVVTVVFV